LERSLREGVKNVRMWGMTTIWLPCLQSNSALNSLNKARDAYNAQLQEGKEMDLDELKTLILESVNVWKNSKKRMLSRRSANVTRPSRSVEGTSTVYSQYSGLDVGFNDFIKDDFILEGDGQVALGSASIPDPVALETEEQRLERAQNECEVVEALGGVC